MIKKATQEDFEQIKSIMDNCVHPSWSVTVLKTAIEDKNNCFFVSTYNSDIDGYICLETCIDEASLSSIAVLPEKRNKGIASALIETAFTECKKRGINRCLLEVEETHLPALKLYEKKGFRQISIRANYYGESGAVIMERMI